MSKSKKLRVEEYVPAATFLMASFVRDRVELSGRFSEFTVGYQSDFKTQLNKVKTLEQSLMLTEKQKMITTKLYLAVDGLNKELNFLSFYFNRAFLDTAILSKVKRDLVRHNVEGACLKLGGLIQYVTEQHVVLESKGMAVGLPAQLSVVKADLEAKNALQNELMDDKGQLFEDNSAEYKLLYGFVGTIIKAGKVMYDGMGKEDEYTMSKIIGRMRFGKTAEVEEVLV
jgi:hypothetical protein